MTELLKIYFKDDQMEMSGADRLLVRVISYSTYGILVAAVIAFCLSDLSWMRGFGFLLFLFLADRILHLGKAEKTLNQSPKKGEINLFYYLSPASIKIIEQAHNRANFLGGDFLLFVIDQLAERKEIKLSLLRLDVNLEELKCKIDDYLKDSLKIRASKEILRQRAEALIRLAYEHAVTNSASSIDPKDLFAVLSKVESENISKLFRLFGIDPGDLENVLIYSHFHRIFSRLKRLPSSLSGLAMRSARVRRRIMNRAWTARPTPILDRFSEDLTDLARSEEIGFLIGHRQEYDRLVDVLSRPGNPNVLLVGEAGSGKNTIISHLAFAIVKDRVPPPLFDRRLVSLEIGNLVSGAGPAEVQERVNKIIEEVVRAGNVMLYISDIHNLVKTSGPQFISAADILLPAIKGPSFSVIGSTYPREFKQYIEPNSDFASTFEIIRASEISELEAIKFLVYHSIILEKQYRIVISFSAIKQAVILAHKYFRQKLLPSAAEEFLNEVVADIIQKGKRLLTADDIIAVAEKKINIPLRRVGQPEAEQLLELENLIHKRLIDQDEAVKAVSRALREYRSGLSRKGGPIASFLFVGPTGVGKTELSKILAKIQFGSTDAMVRLDMSEYQEKQSISRLIGSPDGSIGGNLTEAVFLKPYCLILLDEFEKAHPDILNLFLQVFDDGRLTDSSGRTVDFQNTIIIATSNAHSEFIKTEIEKKTPMAQIAEQLKKKLTEYFKPELINRFSNNIVFKNLSASDIEAIAKIQLADLAELVRGAQEIDLVFDDSATGEIARLGYDPVFGARPLRNVISEKLRGVLAEKILRQEIGRGNIIKVNFKDGVFQFQKSN